MHVTVMIPQVRGLIPYYQNRESQSYRPSLKRLSHDDSRKRLLGVGFIAARPMRNPTPWFNLSVYGFFTVTLKSHSMSVNTRFDEVIRGYDFIKNESDPCVYKKIRGSTVLYLVLYLDDILLICNDVKMLSTQFFMNDMGEASYILGIKIYRDRSRKMLGLTQSSYIENVFKRFKMQNSKWGFLRMRHGIKLSDKQFSKTNEELKRMSDIPYLSP
ncbi:UNVERIFIED_CONTAM: hypothetical protein Scaly_3027700 [Sesamum calycinum]|uniref:Reverse transcriptase Ty1/copia-type domain-containing protein n=1 Tax=Sesamum calycinum TaxID=2727403 RepID=A0AAW2K9S3_9LAMI